MSEINWGAIHSAYNEHLGKQGMKSPPPPQPQAHDPLNSLMVHAMSTARNKEGEDHGTMLIRALHELAKKTIPDVSGIHKQPTQPTGGA